VVWVAGVDGCRAGWFAVLREVETGRTQHAGPLNHISDVLALPLKPKIIGLDIPIGLPDHAQRGGRECDKAARNLLKKPRASSVFNPPVRAALMHRDNCAEARRVNIESSELGISLSAQTCAILDKIAEVDRVLSPQTQRRVKEIHPELSFFELNGRAALQHPKKKKRGFDERRKLLNTAGFEALIESLIEERPSGVRLDDVLDAGAGCWTAERILSGLGVCVPDSPKQDGKSLRMEIWR
jgi:predicted RNase H-like nuclease